MIAKRLLVLGGVLSGLLAPIPAMSATPVQAAASRGCVESAPPSPPSHGSFVARLRDDLADLVRRPAHMRSKDWQRLGIGLAAIGASASLDTEIRARVQRHRTSRSENFADSIRPAGEWGGSGAPWPPSV